MTTLGGRVRSRRENSCQNGTQKKRAAREVKLSGGKGPLERRRKSMAESGQGNREREQQRKTQGSNHTDQNNWEKDMKKRNADY